MPQPLVGIPITVANLPRRMRVVDMERSLRAAGYRLVWERCQLLAVRIH